jgi:hypothetical protein
MDASSSVRLSIQVKDIYILIKPLLLFFIKKSMKKYDF